MLSMQGLIMPNNLIMLKVIVEGQTEEAVCKYLLAPHFLSYNIILSSVLIGGKGGTRSFDILISDVKKIAQSMPGCFITTLFDYYRLNLKWPDVVEIKKGRFDGLSSFLLVEKITKAIDTAVVENVSLDILWKNHFIPYVQLHELEALLFSGPKEMAETFNAPQLEQQFADIVMQCNSCENINDNYETAPSRRIERIYSRYKKGKSDKAHAPIILKNIGLPRIRTACPRFDCWVSTLENPSRSCSV